MLEHVVRLIPEVDDGDEGQAAVVAGRPESLRQRPVELRVQQVEVQSLVGAALQASDGVQQQRAAAGPRDAPAADAELAERTVGALDAPAGGAGELNVPQIQTQSPAVRDGSGAVDTQLTDARFTAGVGRRPSGHQQ